MKTKFYLDGEKNYQKSLTTFKADGIILKF